MEQSAFAGRPDYRVDILARRNRVTVSAGEQLLADSQRTLLVDEQDHQIDLATALGVEVPDVSGGPRGRALRKNR